MKKIRKYLLPLLCIVVLLCIVPTYSLTFKQNEYLDVDNQDENVELKESILLSEDEENTQTNNQNKLNTSDISDENVSENNTTTVDKDTSSQINTGNESNPLPAVSQDSKKVSTNQILSEKLGTFGRLYIPSINLDVAVYYANIWDDENYDAQAIVDRSDSAAFYELGGQYIIADHNYQGFNKLANVQIGTTGYIKLQNGSTVNIRVKDKFIGKNLGYDLVDNSNISVQDMDKSLIMYTCYNNNKDILITRWGLA